LRISPSASPVGSTVQDRPWRKAAGLRQAKLLQRKGRMS
jgi:hypothetical protein